MCVWSDICRPECDCVTYVPIMTLHTNLVLNVRKLHNSTHSPFPVALHFRDCDAVV